MFIYVKIYDNKKLKQSSVKITYYDINDVNQYNIIDIINTNFSNMLDDTTNYKNPVMVLIIANDLNDNIYSNKLYSKAFIYSIKDKQIYRVYENRYLPIIDDPLWYHYRLNLKNDDFIYNHGDIVKYISFGNVYIGKIESQILYNDGLYYTVSKIKKLHRKVLDIDSIFNTVSDYLHQDDIIGFA